MPKKKKAAVPAAAPTESPPKEAPNIPLPVVDAPPKEEPPPAIAEPPPPAVEKPPPPPIEPPPPPPEKPATKNIPLSQQIPPPPSPDMVDQVKAAAAETQRRLKAAAETTTNTPPAPSIDPEPPSATAVQRLMSPRNSPRASKESPSKKNTTKPKSLFGSFPPPPPPPPFTTLALKPCDLKMAEATFEAQADARGLVKPAINKSARFAVVQERDLPVEDILIGKWKGWEKKRARQARAEVEEQLKQCDFKQKQIQKPKSTDALAQRYAERTGQTSSERLIAPAKPGRERVLAEHAALESQQTPFSPNISATSPVKSSSSHMRAVTRGVPNEAYETIPSPPQDDGTWIGGLIGSGGGFVKSGGNRRASGAVGVAERAAQWAQLRDRRLQQLAHQKRRSEAAECTFRPKPSSRANDSTYVAPVVGSSSTQSAGTLGYSLSARRFSTSSSFDMFSRGTQWQAQKEIRLAAARNEQRRRETEPIPTMRVSAAAREAEVKRLAEAAAPWALFAASDYNSATDVGGEEPEPRFMAPTASARERVMLKHVGAAENSRAAEITGESPTSDARRDHPPPPEWAAPLLPVELQ